MGGGLILNPTSHELQLGSTVYGGPAIGRCQCCKGWNGAPAPVVYVTFNGIMACSVGGVDGTGPILNGNVYALPFDEASCDTEYYMSGHPRHRCKWRYTDSSVDITFQHYTSGWHSEFWNGSVEDVQIRVRALTYGDNGIGNMGWRDAFLYHNYAKMIPPCYTGIPSLNVVGECVYSNYYLLRHGYSGTCSWRTYEFEPWVSGQTWAIGDIVIHNGVFYIYVGPDLYNDSEPGVDPDWSLYWDYAPDCPPPPQWVGGRQPMWNHPAYTNPGSVFVHAHTWVSNNGVWYRTGGGHWALPQNEPGVGTNWQSYWAVLPN